MIGICLFACSYAILSNLSDCPCRTFDGWWGASLFPVNGIFHGIPPIVAHAAGLDEKFCSIGEILSSSLFRGVLTLTLDVPTSFKKSAFVSS